MPKQDSSSLRDYERCASLEKVQEAIMSVGVSRLESERGRKEALFPST
jgi:hypothetical protein